MREQKSGKESFNFAGELRPVELKISSAKMPAGCWISLPQQHDTTLGIPPDVLDMLGVSDMSDCELLTVRSGGLEVSVGIKKYASTMDAVQDVQRLCRLLEQFQANSRTEQFQAAVAYEDCVFLWEAVEIGEHLDAYTFLSESEFREQAKQELAAKGMDPHILELCFDFKRYAAIRYGYEDLYYSADTELYVHKVDGTFEPCRGGPLVQDSIRYGQVYQPQMGV